MKKIKQQLQQGMPKKDIFEQAQMDGVDMNKVAKYLSKYPDSDVSAKYNGANIALIGLYSTLISFTFIGILDIVLALPPVLIFGVFLFYLAIPWVVMFFIYKKHSIGYLILSFFLVKGIFDILSAGQVSIAELVGVAINVFLLAFTVILKNKLFPYQNFLHIKRDAQGVIVFTQNPTVS